jgi:hypothetical protein
MSIDISDIYDLSDSKEYTINLNRAQKYITKLKTHQNAGVKLVECSIDLFSLARSKNESNYLDTISRLSNEYINSRKERRIISYDIIRLKEALHKQNVLLELDNLLSLHSFLNAELVETKYMLTRTVNIPLNKNNLEELKDAHKNINVPDQNNTLSSMDVAIYNKSELENTIIIVAKKIEQIETKRDKLNNNTNLTVSLTKLSSDILGL